MPGMEIQDKLIFHNFFSCRKVADKTLEQVWNLLGNEVAAPGCSAAAMRSHAGGREEHLTHPGMNEGQHASSVGRLQRLGHELCSSHKLACGYECGCHPA